MGHCRCLCAGTSEAPVQAQGTQELIQEIVKHVPAQSAVPTGPFKFSIDHCFSIRGQGTVMTGTVLSGKAQVGDMLELPELKVQPQNKYHAVLCTSVASLLHWGKLIILR